MTSHTCLNCGTEVHQAYCPSCGQSTTTHRFSLKHILSHDLVHGVLHLDKGFFFTLKELLTNPGKSIRKYVEGQRVRHYNYFAMLLLLVGACLLTISLTGFKFSDLVNTSQPIKGKVDNLIQPFLEHYKIVMFLLLPMYTLVTFLIFFKAKQNVAEHFVLNTYRLCLELIFQCIFFLIFPLLKIIPFGRYIWSVVPIIYVIWFYRQYFDKDFKNKAVLVLLSIAAYIICAILLGLSAALLVKNLNGNQI